MVYLRRHVPSALPSIASFIYALAVQLLRYEPYLIAHNLAVAFTSKLLCHCSVSVAISERW